MAESEIKPLFPQLRQFGHLDAHHRFFISLGAAALAFLIVPWHWHWPTRVCAIWNVYSLSMLFMTWTALISADPSEVAKTACLQDSSRTFIFLFVVAAAITSVFAVGMELGTAKGLDRTHLGGHVVFAILTVLSSWSLVHTVFTLRYAHIFYGSPEGDEAKGGLEFPDEDKPDYLDFAYFSFVIGMTSQVSDVTIHSRRFRRLALMHGLIAFGFNAAILGLSINMVSGLFS